MEGTNNRTNLEDWNKRTVTGLNPRLQETLKADVNIGVETFLCQTTNNNPDKRQLLRNINVIDVRALINIWYNTTHKSSKIKVLTLMHLLVSLYEQVVCYGVNYTDCTA